MVSEGEQELINSLRDILKLYDIELDEPIAQDDDTADYSEVIGKTQIKLDELNQKAEEIFAKTGMSRDELEAYANNPNNFSQEQWDALQKVKESCDKFKKRAHGMIERGQEQTQTKKKKKKQMGRFAKKKDWLAM